MPVVNCPHCAQPLQLSDQMLGQTLQCPVCTKAFQYGTITQAPPPIVVAPPPPAGGGGFEFGETEQAGYRRVRVGSIVDGAAASLMVGFALAVVFSICNVGMFLYVMGLIGPMGERIMAQMFAALMLKVVLLILLVIGPAVFVAVGSSALKRQWSYGFAMTGAVLGIILAIVLLGFSALMILDAIPGLNHSRFAAAACIELIVVLIALLAVVFNLIGAIRALLALQHPDVRRAFATNAARYYQNY